MNNLENELENSYLNARNVLSRIRIILGKEQRSLGIEWAEDALNSYLKWTSVTLKELKEEGKI